MEKNKSIATKLKEASRSTQVSFLFQTILFPLLVRVSNNENRPQNCAERLQVAPTCVTLKLAVTWYSYQWISERGVLHVVV
jgi:hypothetical protein